MTFKIPNQKKTTNNAKRENGTEIILKNEIILKSKDSRDIEVL